jgi:hypothetical protein
MHSMSKKQRAVSPPAPAGLAKGQLWKLNHVYIQIVELGKKLIHYRMLSDLKETGAKIKTSGVDVMWGYLKSRRAQLIESAVRNPALRR